MCKKLSNNVPRAYYIVCQTLSHIYINVEHMCDYIRLCVYVGSNRTAIEI